MSLLEWHFLLTIWCQHSQSCAMTTDITRETWTASTGNVCVVQIIAENHFTEPIGVVVFRHHYHKYQYEFEVE